MRRHVALALLMLPACNDSIPGYCRSDSDCTAPAYCYLSFCVVGDGDAGAQDGGADAGAPPTVSIVHPAQDGACDASCVGAVVRASDTAYGFQGSVADPSGLRDDLAWSISGGSSVAAQGTTPVVDGGWSYSWDVSGLKDDGVAYVFEITATNSSGVSATAQRSVWVDRVSPKIASSVDGKSGVARDAALVTFTEPMDVASVLSVASLNGIPVGGSFGSTDGVHFGFSNPANLKLLTSYQLSFSSGANDRAGNPLSSTEISFVTESAPPPSGTQTVGQTGASSPRIVVDADGRPFIAYATSTGPHVVYWDGISSWIDLALTASVLSASEPKDIAISSLGIDDASLAVHALFVDGTNVYYVRAPLSNPKVWSGAAGTAPDLLSSNASSSYRPAFGRAPGDAKFPVKLAVLLSEGGNVVYRSINWGGEWGGATTLMATGTGAGGGAGLADTIAWYLDPLMPAGVASNTGLAAQGPAMARQRLGSGVAYMFWTNQVVAQPASFSQLTLSCSPNPAISGSWKPGESITQSSKMHSWADPDIAVSDSMVALAYAESFVGMSLPGVEFGSAALGDCLGGPHQLAFTSFDSQPGAGSPSVALGPPNGGTLWGAWGAWDEAFNGSTVVRVGH